MSDFFYDGQIRRFVTQFMRAFIGFKYQSGDGEQKTVPVMYGDMSRQVAGIIKENSENKMPTVPRIACYITGLEMDQARLGDPSFISKINVRERRYDYDSSGAGNEPVYTGEQGANYTVERLMPVPYKLTMKADIWSSNTDQKLQLLEQILVLFRPSLEIQSTDNYIDWTSLSTMYLNNTNFSSRSIPVGTDSDIDICSLEFEMPIYISPPAKVKKLGVIQKIITNIFTEEGDVQSLENLVYSERVGNSRVVTSYLYNVLLFKAANGEPYDYEVTVVDKNQAVQSLGLDEKEFANKNVDWNAVLNVYGGAWADSRIYFLQPNGFEMSGTFAVNPVNPEVLLVTFDQDTIPTNTLISGKGTIDAIVNPLTFNPIERWNGAANIPTGTRYLLLETIGDPSNTDGAEGWKGSDGSTQLSYILRQNDIVEWNGSQWETVFASASVTNITYVTNIRTGIQYKWDGEQWLKSFEGEYSPGYWRLDMNP